MAMGMPSRILPALPAGVVVMIVNVGTTGSGRRREATWSTRPRTASASAEQLFDLKLPQDGGQPVRGSPVMAANSPNCGPAPPG